MNAKKTTPTDDKYLGGRISLQRPCTRCHEAEAMGGALLCARCTQDQTQFVNAFFQEDPPVPPTDPAEEASLRQQLEAATRALDMLKAAVTEREREVAELEAKLARRR